MSQLLNVQLVSVIVGGLLATVGSIATTTILERQRQRRESRNLALAFKGEIGALLALVEERRYIERIGDVVAQIEATREPFYMPFRVRYAYDRVYAANVDRVGMLAPRLAEQLPLFYTRVNSILEDLVSLGDGSYTEIGLDQLLHLYCTTRDILGATLVHGRTILATIDDTYALPPTHRRGR